MKNKKIPRQPMSRLHPEWLGHIAEQVGEGVAVADLKGKIIFANQAWARMHGYKAGEIVGRNLSMFHNPRQMKEDVIPFNRNVRKKGHWKGIVGHIRKDGTPFTTEMTTTLFRDQHRRPIGLVGFAKDISDRVKAERADQALDRVMKMVNLSNQAIARAGEEQALLQEICDVMVRTGGYVMSWVGVVQPRRRDKILPVVSSGIERGYLRSVSINLRGRLGSGPTGLALRTGRPAICHNILSDPKYRPWRKEAIKRGYAASAAFPLIAGGEHYGVLNVYSDRTGAFAKQELSLLRELCHDLAYGIRSLRQRQINQLFFEVLPDFFFRIDAGGTIMDYRGGRARDLYLPPSRFIGQKVDRVLPEEVAKQVKAALAGTIRTRKATVFEYSLILKGRRRHYEARMMPLGENQVTALVRDVTRRKQSEEELGRTRQQFQTLANISPVGIFQTKPDGSTTYTNPQWSRISGISSDKALRYDWLKAVHPDDRKRVAAGWRKSVRDRSASSTVYRFLRRDGTVRWVIGQAVPEHGVRGQITGYAGTVTDITELKKAEEALKGYQEFNQAIISHSPIGTAIREKDGRLVGYNQAWQRIWSMPEQMVEKMKRPMTPAQLRKIYSYIPEHLPGILKVFRQGGTYYIPEIHIAHPRPGQAEWINQHFYTIRDKKGGIDKIIVLVEDITERKKAQDDLRRSEEFNRSIVARSPVGITVRDMNGRLVTYNEAWKNIWKLTDGDIREKEKNFWNRSFKDRYPFLAEKYPDAEQRFNSGEPFYLSELATLNPEPGSAQWISLMFYPLMGKDGRAEQMVTMTLDITERKRTEEELAESELKYRQIFEDVAEGIYRSSPDGKIILANPAMVKMLGYRDLEELKRINLNVNGYLDPSNRQRFQELLDKRGEVRGFQSNWRRRDGSEIVISENVRLVRDKQGRPLYYEGTVEDITERVKADLALLDEKNKLVNLLYVSLNVARSETTQEMLEVTLRGLDELKLFRRLAMVIQEEQNSTELFSHIGLSKQDLALVQKTPLVPPSRLKEMLDREHRISNSYYMPFDAPSRRHLLSLHHPPPTTAAGDWHPGDSLVIPLAAKGENIGYIVALDPVDGNVPTIEMVRLLELYANQVATALDNLRLYDNLEDSYYDTLKAFVAAMEAKDPYTKGHSENVQHYAIKLAHYVGLSADRIQVIDYSSLLHDIGKLGVREVILVKPSALTDSEYEEVKQHPLVGSQMVAPIQNLGKSAPIIRAHHEYFDGSGYPGGLRGSQIPLESQIISVADAFEAMTSDRPYRKAFSREEALRRLQEASGKQFDKSLVDSFINMLKAETA